MVTMSSRIRRTPVKVGYYDVQKTIGRGNFAEVKLARHRITKTEVAIKIIDKTSLDQGNLKKIYREIQILKLLNHQHIIKLYQVMQTKTTIYLVCEYARNGELFDYITQKGKLPEERAQSMFWQVLCAVEYCHKNNVVHRDLKAENMLLDGNNNIKLADFGFGNFFQSGQNLSTWCGSPPYAAPEVFEGKLYEGPQLDVWSLGVVLYVLVCGTFPFDGSNLSTLKERVLGGLFRIPYWMSQDCENLLRRMLVLNPKKRLTISQIKKHKWLDCVRPRVSSYSNLNDSVRRGKPSEYNEHVFKIMQNLGLDITKTKESLNLSAYDHFYAIYHLLADRLKLHRTSYPLESQVSQRRRPSNIAEQILLSVPKVLASSSQRSSNPLLAGFNKTNVIENTKPNNNIMEIDDICFDDVIGGLPVINRTMVDSPPLPLIKTTLCVDEDAAAETPTQHQHTNFNLLHIPNNNTVPVVQQKLTTAFGYNHLVNTANQLPIDNEIDMTGCNLQHRRHTLMIPDASQVAQFQLGLLTAQNTTPSTSSREFINQQIGNGSHPAYHNMNQFHPSDYTNTVYNEINHKDNSNVNELTEPIKELLHLRQRQRTTLNSSPIGFREGRRASDGLLLLGDSLLKEHLQKLARVKGVPELTKDIETTQTNASSNPPPILNNPSNAECLNPAPTNTLYGSNGESLNFQPYSNMQSLSRRRSLQVQHMQMRRSSVTTVPIPTGLNVENSNHTNALFNWQENFSGSHPRVSESTISAEVEHLRHWSSWKQVQSPTNENAQESPLGSNDNAMFSSVAMSIASDDSVPSKAAVAAQIQRDSLQKPIRQQSLPISSNPKGNYPFSSAFSNHTQSLAQQLQQRRFERRIKVASHQSAMSYQSPLPELEHLRIGGEDQLSHYPISTIACNGVMLNLNASKGQDNDQFSQENSVHGIRCFGTDELNFGTIGGQMPVADLTYENNLPINDPNLENMSFLNFGNNDNPVLSWVHNSCSKQDSMEYVMY